MRRQWGWQPEILQQNESLIRRFYLISKGRKWDAAFVSYDKYSGKNPTNIYKTQKACVIMWLRVKSLASWSRRVRVDDNYEQKMEPLWFFSAGIWTNLNMISQFRQHLPPTPSCTDTACALSATMENMSACMTTQKKINVLKKGAFPEDRTRTEPYFLVNSVWNDTFFFH